MFFLVWLKIKGGSSFFSLSFLSNITWFQKSEANLLLKLTVTSHIFWSCSPLLPSMTPSPSPLFSVFIRPRFSSLWTFLFGIRAMRFFYSKFAWTSRSSSDKINGLWSHCLPEMLLRAVFFCFHWHHSPLFIIGHYLPQLLLAQSSAIYGMSSRVILRADSSIFSVWSWFFAR